MCYESNDNEEDEGQDEKIVLKSAIIDGRTEQCWCYSDYAALKNDGSFNMHTKFYFCTKRQCKKNSSVSIVNKQLYR